MDVVCLREINVETDYVFPNVSNIFMIGGDKTPLKSIRDKILNPSRSVFIDSWFIKAPPQSDLMVHCYEKAMSMAGSDMEWGALGPDLLRNGIDKLGLHQYASMRFFPNGWKKPEILLKDSLLARIYWAVFAPNCYAVHLYNEMWRIAKIDKNLKFADSSIIEKLKAKYPNKNEEILVDA
jgi:hypothetical protein